jgi:2-polyprenyl-3-methyl-5-hydroxy-6-metoxy-1,4-benzoquinol methylase
MTTPESHHIINQPWPEADLEHLGCCPLCGSEQRIILYKGLRDRVFFCAPGSWTMYQCEACDCAYLDPRPTPKSMSKAYESYFTYEREDQEAPVSRLKQIKHVFKNGYLNRKWATSLSPASQALGLLLLPSMRALLDGQLMRHLPRPAEKRTLLDVGCGGGLFLSLAQSAGWQVTGFDIDPKSVETARSRGLNVNLGSFETLSQAPDCFDAITVSHVIEHAYNPRELLADCYRLLKPGGYFWIETPNMNSYGHMQFKESWFDLDPPRHLVMQNWQLLQQMLAESGFRHIKPVAWCPEYRFRYMASKAVQLGTNQHLSHNNFIARIKSSIIETLNRFDHKKREFITFQATK